MGFWNLKTRLWKWGRVSQMFEPRDVWVGWFHGEDADYIVIVPMLPFRIERGPRAPAA
jgi:hypothetical protein